MAVGCVPVAGGRRPEFPGGEHTPGDADAAHPQRSAAHEKSRPVRPCAARPPGSPPHDIQHLCVAPDRARAGRLPSTGRLRKRSTLSGDTFDSRRRPRRRAAPPAQRRRAVPLRLHVRTAATRGSAARRPRRRRRPRRTRRCFHGHIARDAGFREHRVRSRLGRPALLREQSLGPRAVTGGPADVHA